MHEIFGVRVFLIVFLFIPTYFFIAVKLEVPVLKRLNKLVRNKCIHNAKSVNNMCTRNSCNIIAFSMGQVIWFCLMSQTSVKELRSGVKSLCQARGRSGLKILCSVDYWSSKNGFGRFLII